MAKKGKQKAYGVAIIGRAEQMADMSSDWLQLITWYCFQSAV